MSDSTIDDAIRLLEVGKGNPDRLKQIIESFETRSLIPLQDRKYVEALVQQYLTPRHRIKIKKIEPVKKQQSDFPKTLKSTKPKFEIQRNEKIQIDKIPDEKSQVGNFHQRVCTQCGYQNFGENNFCNECGTRLMQPEKGDIETPVKRKKDETAFEKYEREYLERQYPKTEKVVEETSTEERFVEYLEAKPTKSKKSNKKFVGIGIGIVAILIIAGGAALVNNDADLFEKTEIVERASCDNEIILVSTTKIPNFPDPEKDLQYYLDRYNNEPNYKDWFDRNFPDQTIQSVVCS